MKSVCYLCASIVAVVIISILPLCSASSVILVEDAKVCFRRALAGKRVSRIFIRKAVSCERVEHCQQECAEEKRFTCEGFNYRIDPSGSGRGDCELIDVPYVQLDLRRDIIPDPDYDYYEKDRNNYPNCKEHRPPFRPTNEDYLPRPQYNNRWPSRDHFSNYDSQDRFTDRYDSNRDGFDQRPPNYDQRPTNERFDERNGPYNRRNDYYGELHISRNKYEDRYNTNRYDYSYDHSASFASNGKDYDYKSYEPYIPPRSGYDYKDDAWNLKKPYHTIRKPTDSNHWGKYGGSYGDFGKGYLDYGNIHQSYDYPQRNFEFPPSSSPKYWGQYGGTYGTGGYHDAYEASNYWRLNSINQNKFTDYDEGNRRDIVGGENIGYIYPKPTVSNGDVGYPREPPLVFNECSLRTATGYRLYKSVIKKILSVPTIYDCESACFREKDFICTSYAFRYIVGSGIPPNNCYLSDKNYKKLDYYTDLQQDRNFDIYSMNNRGQCDTGIPHQSDSSECFLHVRSGLRLHDTCVKNSILVKSMVDCEIACLHSTRFICRTISFRYGSPVIGGTEENCQLTDIQYNKLDPRRDFIFDPSFVVYERASFGYGCEINHLPSLDKPTTISLGDELCYIGFGWPAKLLPDAVKRVLKVDTEAECKTECSKARMETPFCCMSFSYKSTYQKDEPNCYLSDIFQRDLLQGIDYIKDPDYWLFSWDSNNPQCHFPSYHEQRQPPQNIPGSLTWRIYSVGGWPCKRGSLCKQSDLGFWFCELEGGSPSAWDYCCRPTHQCGYSEEFPYQWCYVGPRSTQWRKCNNKYYPYLPSQPSPPPYIPTQPSRPAYIPTHPSNLPSKPTFIPDRRPSKPPSTYLPPPTSEILPPKKTYLPPAINQPRPWITTGKPIQTHLQPPNRLGFRPDRPQAFPQDQKPAPSLNEYEEQFDSFFLDPPKPGGFGQPRHWPVSYLHKEMPPNVSVPLEQKFDRMKMKDEINIKPKLDTIQNLIEAIKTNDMKDIRYQITNTSDRASDVLYVQIPLPSDFSESSLKQKPDDKLISQPIDLLPSKSSPSNLNITKQDNNDISNLTTDQNKTKEKHNTSRSLSLYRKGFIEKTNLTNYARSRKFV